MTPIHLCTDSSALLPEGEAARLGVTVTPVHVALDGEPFDGGTDEFYERLDAGARATTSAPSPGELLAAYRVAAECSASRVLSVHLDARVSGTVAAAELAAREAPIPVDVVDTRTTSYGVGLCVRAAAAALSRGSAADEAAERARALGASLRNVFVARGAGGGRLGSGPGWTVLRLVGARAEQEGTYASPEDALTVMAAVVLESRRPLRAAVGHAAARTEGWAHELVERLVEDPRVEGVQRYRVGPSVGAHTGPMAFGAFWWPVS